MTPVYVDGRLIGFAPVPVVTDEATAVAAGKAISDLVESHFAKGEGRP